MCCNFSNLKYYFLCQHNSNQVRLQQIFTIHCMFLCRCLFLKFSTKATTFEVKPNSFLHLFIVLTHLTILFNITTYAWETYGKPPGSRTNFLLYHACYNPNEGFSISFYNVMPISTIMLFGFDAIIIGGNMYLYRFLNNYSDKREGQLPFIYLAKNNTSCVQRS